VLIVATPAPVKSTFEFIFFDLPTPRAAFPAVSSISAFIPP